MDLDQFVDQLVERKLNERLNQQGLNTSFIDDANHTVTEIRETPKKRQTEIRNREIKSPSDTTLYAPALKLITHRNEPNLSEIDIMSKISNFVDGIRLEHEQRQSSVRPAQPRIETRPAPQQNQDVQPSTSGV